MSSVAKTTMNNAYLEGLKELNPKVSCTFGGLVDRYFGEFAEENAQFSEPKRTPGRYVLSGIKPS